MSASRQLAAIMFTDIVGYTAFMQENEQKAVALIKHHNAALEKTVVAHKGKVLNYYGDGSLCTFPSATEAVQCAADLQIELLTEPVVPLRIGLHIGEIFFEQKKVIGDGVNIASRIQSLGQANTVLFSKEIFNKIRNHPEFKAVSLGHFDLKNVDEPMEVFALTNEGLAVPKREKIEGKLKKKNGSKRKLIVVIAVVLLIASGFVYKKFSSNQGFTGKVKSIAVLPFQNTSNDPEQEVFSDGITQDIIGQISKIKDVEVRGWNSVLQFKKSNKSLKE